ncbi:MAG: hypothetical protein SCK70_12005, partial [bacterium]|nr:hypothetical protein [bacterium]
MNIDQLPLQQSRLLNVYDNIANWRQSTASIKKCSSCGNVIREEYCQTGQGAECINCVFDAIKNCTASEKTDGFTLSAMRRIFSNPDNLRWRLFFLTRFLEFLKQENPSNHFGLYVLLIQQLGYVSEHPLSKIIRQAAFDTCLKLGNDIMPLLTKLYRRLPWQFNINVVILALQINPTYDRVQNIAETAAENKEPEVRLRLAQALKNIDATHSWIFEIMLKLSTDPNPTVRQIAKEYVYSRSTARTEPSPQPAKNKLLNSHLKDDQFSGRNLFTLYEDLRTKLTPLHHQAEPIIKEVYSFESLKKIFTQLLIPLLKENDLIDSEFESFAKIKKSYLTTIFTYLILDEKLFSLLLNRLPDKVQSLFTTMNWEGGEVDVAELEKEFDVKILSASKSAAFISNQIINPDFFLFQSKLDYDYFSSKRQHTLFLSEELRAVFKLNLPKPKAAILKTITDLPTDCLTYADKNQFAYRVDIFLEYCRQNRIQHTKTTGQILKSYLNKWQRYFNIQEFYPEKSNMLDCLFSKLILNFLAKIENLEITLDNSDKIKNMLVNYFQFNNFKQYHFIHLLPHIQGLDYVGSFFEKEIRHSFYSLLKDLNQYDWISIKNVLMNIKCGNKHFKLLESKQ